MPDVTARLIDETLTLTITPFILTQNAAGQWVFPAEPSTLSFSATPTAWTDTAITIDRTDYIETSPLARAVFTTTATELSVSGFANLQPSAFSFSEIGVIVDGVWRQSVIPGATGAFSGTITGLAAGSKTIELVNGLTSKVGGSGTTLGTWLKSVSANAAITQIFPTATNKTLFLADSIGVGGNSAAPTRDSYIARLRRVTTDSLIVYGWGFNQLDSIAGDSTKRAALMSIITPLAPTRIVDTLGTNDWALVSSNPTTLATKKAALYDLIHTALPSASVFAVKIIIRNPDATTNGQGFTPDEFRGSVDTAATGRSWVTPVDGKAFMTVAQLVDEVHPSTYGHLKWAQGIDGLLGYTVPDDYIGTNPMNAGPDTLGTLTNLGGGSYTIEKTSGTNTFDCGFYGAPRTGDFRYSIQSVVDCDIMIGVNTIAGTQSIFSDMAYQVYATAGGPMSAYDGATPGASLGGRGSGTSGIIWVDRTGTTVTFKMGATYAGASTLRTVTLSGTIALDFSIATVGGKQTVTVADVAAQQVILAVLAGQSNMEGGRGATRDGTDLDVANVFQFVGWPSAGNYRTISSDITPLLHIDNFSGITGADLGPGEYIGRQLLADNPAAKIILVPTAKGSTGMADVTLPWYPHATAGGSLFENMITQANLARTAALAAYPGAAITFQFYWVQGEYEAGNAITRATYTTHFTNFIAFARSRITGATGAKFVVGSMIPRLWDPASPQYNAGYAGINAAHVDASVDIANVLYQRGSVSYSTESADGLHYSPAAQVRLFGTRLGAVLSDVVGPTMTSAASFSNLVTTTLTLALTSDDPHATFHINGGAGAANFEISDRYLTPTLRWTGNGTGPAAGAYVVGIRARDGAGNYGTTQTVTITAATEISPATFFTTGERGMVWDLTTLANLKQNINGTGAVTTVGDPVGYVADLSGNGNHWIAKANDTTRPTYQVDSDGKAYLAVASASSQALIAAAPFIHPTNWRFTTCVGLYGGTQGSYGSILASASHTMDYPIIEAPQFASADLILTATADGTNGIGTSPTLTGALNSTKRAITSAFFGDGASWRMRDAAARPAGGGTGSYQTVAPGGGSGRTYNNVTRSVLGARGYDGISLFPSRFFNGRIYSGFAIGRAITDAEVKSSEQWVAARTLAGTLP